MRLPDDFPRGIEALACDLDRTLVWEDAVLHGRTLEAVRAARDAGIHVLIATGRMFRSVVPYLAELGLDEPVVCYQGAAVADPVSGRFLQHRPIPLDLAKEAIAAVEAEGFPLNCYVDDQLYVASETRHSDRYASFQSLSVQAVGDLRAWLDQPPTKLVAIGEPTAVDALQRRMRELFNGRLFIAKSLPYFLEFASPDVSKGSGLAFVAARLGFEAKQTVAFGDGENDVELLEWAGYGVAVANADERLRALADWVCPAAYEQGVAQVIEALLDSRA